MSDIVNLPPEQMAEMLRQEKLAQEVARKILNVLNTHRVNPNAALAAVSAVAVFILEKVPMEHRDKYFQGFQLGVRDGAFGQTSIGMPVQIPPPNLLKK